jgi:hypothetical protein
MGEVMSQYLAAMSIENIQQKRRIEIVSLGLFAFIIVQVLKGYNVEVADRAGLVDDYLLWMNRFGESAYIIFCTLFLQNNYKRYQLNLGDKDHIDALVRRENYRYRLGHMIDGYTLVEYSDGSEINTDNNSEAIEKRVKQAKPEYYE